MECMVVNIERPWLQGELFSDSDLDVGQGYVQYHSNTQENNAPSPLTLPYRFKLSPGETALLETVHADKVPEADYQQFSAYPTAFVIAANVELSFNGDTSSLQSSL